ncbi:MAG: dipeptide epimerase [Ignavibacteriales bacterium]|nr:dipeptide epimerase [Ignavibacteriales bacterium]
MNFQRRDFLKTSALAIGGAALTEMPQSLLAKNIPENFKSGRMKFSFRPYTLELKHVFTLALSSRTTTAVMLTEIEYNGITGYGEASMPPYLGESHATAQAFLSKVDLSKYENPFELETILADIDAIAPGNPAAKASVDIALHDLIGKILNQPWYNIWGFDKTKAPYTSFTIGIDKPDVVRQKVKEAEEFKILKVKLGRDTDKEMIETIRSVTDKPLTADANQGWKDQNYAVEMTHYLKEKGVLYLEQPMAKENVEGNAYIAQHSPIPILGDEAIQRLADLKKAHGVYNGVVIKLMKTTGMREAHKMITLAHALDMKILLGCMTETSCGISAAAQLSPLVDWADLDGNLLIKNDVYSGTTVVNGKLVISDKPGIGIVKV